MSIPRGSQSQAAGEGGPQGYQAPAGIPGGPHPPGPSGPLTAALQRRVSPVKLLALRTGPPPEAGSAVALPCELEWGQGSGQSLNQRRSPGDLRRTAGPTHPGCTGGPYLIAGGACGSTGVAGTGLAATATGKIPEVGGTAVTARTLDIGEAWALPTVWVTVAPVRGRALLGICAQRVADAACTSQDGQ